MSFYTTHFQSYCYLDFKAILFRTSISKKSTYIKLRGCIHLVNSRRYYDNTRKYCGNTHELGMLRVITRPELDPTRSKEVKFPTRTRPENFAKAFDPTRPVPEFFRADPTEIISMCTFFVNY